MLVPGALNDTKKIRKAGADIFAESGLDFLGRGAQTEHDPQLKLFVGRNSNHAASSLPQLRISASYDFGGDFQGNVNL